MLLKDRLPFLAFGKLDGRLIELFGRQFLTGFEFRDPAVQGAGWTIGDAHGLDGRYEVRQAVLFQIVAVRHSLVPSARAQGIMLWRKSMCNGRLRVRHAR